MHRHLRHRHPQQIQWQTTDVRSLIETMKLLGSDLTVSDDVQTVQETEVPLSINADNDMSAESCPASFMSIDSSWATELH